MEKRGGVVVDTHQKMRQLNQLLQEEGHLPGKRKLEQMKNLTQQAGQRVYQLRLFGFKKIHVSNTSAIT